MPTWAQQNANINAAIVDARAFGVTVTYSRNATDTGDAVAPFSVSVSIETGREYESPSGPIYGEVGIETVQVPLGPKKGDLLVLANPTAQLTSGTYFVQEVFNDQQSGWCRLMIRWTGQ